MELDKNPLVTVNPSRLKFLLEQYGLSHSDFLNLINANRKNAILTAESLTAILANKQPILLNHLAAIDKIFEKGISWYLSLHELPEKKKMSIFFRKESFNSQLDFKSKKTIDEFETKKKEIALLCQYINFEPKRILATFSIKNDPKTTSTQVRRIVFERQNILKSQKLIKDPESDVQYLKNLIKVLESFNIFIFEFIENWNVKRPAIFNGFFMHPNFIAIKNQRYTRREIFTLVHEFAHYLLNIEEIDEPIDAAQDNASAIENWCNDFTYYFLIGDFTDALDKIVNADSSNNFAEAIISELYKKTFLSRKALYTHLKIFNRISGADYKKIIAEIDAAITRAQTERKQEAADKRQHLIDQGKELPGFGQKAIPSGLFKEIVTTNYFEGNIDETRLCQYLKIKPENFEREVYSIEKEKEAN